jgi:hypothetical protein
MLRGIHGGAGRNGLPPAPASPRAQRSVRQRPWRLAAALEESESPQLFTEQAPSLAGVWIGPSVMLAYTREVDVGAG